MGIKTDFKPNTLLQNTNALAAYLPNGQLFVAKNLEGSNLRKSLTALANEYGRYQDKIYEVSTEDDIRNTTNLISEWESALGIPDQCLTSDTTIQQRRKQIEAKFALMNLTTESDWIYLANFFGFTITIEHGSQASLFPMTFPILFSGSVKAAKFTMIIKFMGLRKPGNIFTMKFPITFEQQTNYVLCLFEKLKPANVNIVYRWELE